LILIPSWFIERYPNRQAVVSDRDFELLEDFRYAVMVLPLSSYGGVVTGWMSRELMQRGIRA
jgi:hypothetical protein